jgi:hypothetical protein
LHKFKAFGQILIGQRREKNLKKGLKKGEWWFRMELSGEEWRQVV